MVLADAIAAQNILRIVSQLVPVTFAGQLGNIDIGSRRDRFFPEEPQQRIEK